MGVGSRTPQQRAQAEAAVERVLRNGNLPRYDKSIHTKVVGVKHSNPDGTSRQAAIEQISQFEFVELVRNPDDEFDCNAIQVFAEIASSSSDKSRVQIGFISADLAEELASDIDSGEPWRAIVTGVGGYITKGVSLMLFRECS